MVEAITRPRAGCDGDGLPEEMCPVDQMRRVESGRRGVASLQSGDRVVVPAMSEEGARVRLRRGVVSVLCHEELEDLVVE